MDLNLDPLPVTVHILRCEYFARCGARGCRSQSTTIAREMDAVGQFVRQIECDEHGRVVMERERARRP